MDHREGCRGANHNPDTHTMKTQSLEDRVRAAITRNPDYPNSRITKNMNSTVSAAFVQQVRESMKGQITPTATESSATGVKGISLQSKRVITHRPVETAAKHIKRLPKGRGFNPKDLAIEWGMSEETVKKYARDMKCIKFVEISEDEWVPMIMNPETAAQY